MTGTCAPLKYRLFYHQCQLTAHDTNKLVTFKAF